MYLTYLKNAVYATPLWVGAIVVMNNLPVNHAEAVESLIQSVGFKVKLLLPYSPNLFSIELCL